MAEVLLAFDSEVRAADGRGYLPRACGVEADGRWQGWIEFVPLDGSTVLRTGRETTQRSREDLLYWASGLTAVYLEGALHRALSPLPARSRRPRPPLGPRPAYEGPAPDGLGRVPDVADGGAFDPFTAYAGGSEVLRRGLASLEADELRGLIRTYGLSDASAEDLVRLTPAQLRSVIERAIQERVDSR